MKLLLCSLLLCLLVLRLPALRAAEPLLQPNDVIALVGGEDMVVAAERGYLELALTRALPQHRLKLRGLAWEGDTVYEQPRDLNYPTLEQQLEEVGATVVIAHFGLGESLAGAGRLPEFVAAYEKLIGQLRGEKSRCVVLVGPVARTEVQQQYERAIRQLAGRLALPYVALPAGEEKLRADQLHLSPTEGQQTAARLIAQQLTGQPTPAEEKSTGEFQLVDAIRAKNRLWFNYARPQNWAFLNGDRTIQPSSRDHLDPSKRWFPEEMQQWLPLIAAKEAEIWDLSAKLPATR